MAVYEYHNSQLSIVVVLQWYRVSVCAELPLICYSIVVRIWQQLLLFSNKALCHSYAIRSRGTAGGAGTDRNPSSALRCLRPTKEQTNGAHSIQLQSTTFEAILYITTIYSQSSKTSAQSKTQVQLPHTLTTQKGLLYTTYMLTKLIYTRTGHCLSHHTCA